VNTKTEIEPQVAAFIARVEEVGPPALIQAFHEELKQPQYLADKNLTLALKRAKTKVPGLVERERAQALSVFRPYNSE